MVRNQGKLPAGRLYLSFPIWTLDLLNKQQVAKAEAVKKAKEYELETNEKLSAMRETNNIFMKALRYRDATEAYEKVLCRVSNTMTLFQIIWIKFWPFTVTLWLAPLDPSGL